MRFVTGRKQMGGFSTWFKTKEPGVISKADKNAGTLQLGLAFPSVRSLALRKSACKSGSQILGCAANLDTLCVPKCFLQAVDGSSC